LNPQNLELFFQKQNTHICGPPYLHNSGSVALSAVISSNEPQNGLGDGDVSPDWTLPVIDQATGQITFQLRAERSGSGNGRIYTIRVSATDGSNNVSSADVKIVVPHDNGKK
jgi:hypothetical protein